MRDLKIHCVDTTAREATNAIFDACRANESRNPKGLVTFWKLSNTESFAYLFNKHGVKIATAIVDEFDV